MKTSNPVSNLKIPALLGAAALFTFTFSVRGQVSEFNRGPVFIEEYGDLFDSVQAHAVFSDQKKFVDCRPKFPPGEILEKYHELRGVAGFSLKRFVAANFDTSFVDTADVLQHIDYLWDYLSRDPDKQGEPGTLLPLRHPYIVPGGRFREIYYWDSYFTMLGLAEAGKTGMIRDMLDNLSDLVETYGHIPNGNRSYYLSRSQPPFFSLMVDLYARCTGDPTAYAVYHDALKKEYEFWNMGKASLTRQFSATERVVRLKGKDFLNRYWDDRCAPRPESYRHDVRTMKESGRDSNLYRDLRAAAESGWDFSSRWFADGRSLASIHTTDLVPVDLNCLLYNLEIALSMGSPEDSLAWKAAAARRKKLIMEYCWDEERGFFYDYDFKARTRSNTSCLAGLYPLFLKIADEGQAGRVLGVIKTEFLKDGGLVTTLDSTGQQWDWPNGWPPLQWIGYESCINYGRDSLAEEIAARWINLNVRVYFETGKMMEKYDVVNTGRPGGGGEYPAQDGFGWTNGVFLRLWTETRER